MDIIKGAMRLINALPTGSVPGDDDQGDLLIYLNWLIDDSSNERLLQASLPTLSKVWPANVKEQSIGDGLDIPVAKLPVKFWSASFIWSDNRTIPMDIIDQEQYDLIVYQNWKGPYPRYLCYIVDSDMNATGKVLIWPLPSRDTQVYIRFQRQLLAFPEYSSTLDLLPGYASWLKYELAVRIAPEWTEQDAPLSVQRMAEKMARQIGVINEQKSHVVSGLTAVAPSYRRGLNGGIPQIYMGYQIGNRGLF